MIELDGVEYPIKNPAENAQDLVAYINNYCEQNNIVNNQGDLIYIDANETNPLYMMCFGMAYLMTDLQKLIYSAGCSMSLNESSERQLLNLADIANVQRKSATKTSIVVTIYANLSDIDSTTGEEQAVPCEIKKYNEETGEGCKVTIAYGNQSLVFVPAYELINDQAIPIDGVATMILICQEEGSYSISENMITSFDINPAGFRRMTSEASNPGQDQETIAALRQRIQYRDTSYTMIDSAILAIEALEGVSSCNIYFNYSTTVNETVRGVTIPPRKAMVIVQGWSDEIAEAFYKNLSCEVVGDASIALEQDYATLAGQIVPFFVFTPIYVALYIRVYMKGSYTSDEQQSIKDTICSLASSTSVGQEISSSDIIQIIHDTYPSFNIQGVFVSLGNEASYTYKATPSTDELITFSSSTITLYTDSGELVEAGTETEPGPEEPDEGGDDGDGDEGDDEP